MSIIKHVTLQKIVAHDFRYDLRNLANMFMAFINVNYEKQPKVTNILYGKMLSYLILSWVVHTITTAH